MRCQAVKEPEQARAKVLNKYPTSHQLQGLMHRQENLGDLQGCSQVKNLWIQRKKKTWKPPRVTTSESPKE